MRKRKMFCSLYFLSFLLSFITGIHHINLVHAEESTTTIYVDPPIVQDLLPPATFSVSIKIANITNLWGVDIWFSWDPSLLEYVDHTVTIPVETYPGGVLYEPILPVADKVNAAAGTYHLAKASMLPEEGTTPSFNGSGTVFNMTFQVKATGSCVLEITSSDLAGKTPPGPIVILHERNNGYFTNFTPPPAQIYVTPSRIVNASLTPCSNFTIEINLEDVFDLNEFEFWLGYNTTILDASNVTIDPAFPPTQTEIQIVELEGKMRIAGWLLPLALPITGDLSLVSIVFHVSDVGLSVLDVYNVTLVDKFDEEIPCEEPSDGYFNNMLITRLFVDPPEIIDPTIVPPMTFTIYIKIENVEDMYAYEFELVYDTAILNCLGVITFPPTDDTSFSITIHIDDPLGKIWLKVQYYPPATPITIYPPTALAEIVFQVQSLGATVLDLCNTSLKDPNDNSISHVSEDGYFMSLARDVAIIHVSASPNKVYPGRTVIVTVVARNEGNVTFETFNVTAFYDDNPIGTQTVVDLIPRGNATLTFIWDTSGLQPCMNYTIRAEATPVPYESNLENNVYIDGFVKIKMLGDINGDGKVDLYDVALATSIYGSTEEDPDWNPDADIAPPWGVINIYDIVTITARFGQPPC